MPLLKKIEMFDENYYRLNTQPVDGYSNSELGGIPAVPMIHTYSPSMLTTTPLLAMTNESGEINIHEKTYYLSRYLCVQALNDNFLFDEDDNFRPTVKPHYAIQPFNGIGTSYQESCMTLLIEDDEVLENQTISVHIHDHLLSPAISLENLRQRLITAHINQQSLYIESYVVDEKNGSILVTQHCLLNLVDYQKLHKWLDHPDNQNLNALLTQQCPVQDSVVKFQNGSVNESVWLDEVFRGGESKSDAKFKVYQDDTIKKTLSFFRQHSGMNCLESKENHHVCSNYTPFLMKFLAKSSAIVVALALVGFAIGFGCNIGFSNLSVGLYAAGIACIGLVTLFGLWGNRHNQSREKRLENGFQTEYAISKID